MPAQITTSETLVNTDTTGDQWDPTVTILADGGWVVVWIGRVAIGSEPGIFAQRYAADGTPIGGEVQVNSASVDQWEAGPAVAALPDGGWIVTWYADSPPGSATPTSTVAYMQRYDSAGTPAGEVQVSAPDGYMAALHPDVAVLADGGWVIVWHSRHSGTDADEDIYGQRYDSGGAPVDGEFQVNTASAPQHLPSVTALTDGGWIVTWMSSGQDGSGWGVYAQRYNADGSPNGGETLVTTTTAGNQMEPHLATLGDGGWVITWHSSGQDGSGHGIFAQRYDSTGAPVGGEFQVNTTTANDQLYATVEALPDGGFAVVWLSMTGGTDPYGSRTGNIYVQRYDAAGNPVGGETLVGVSSEGSHSNLNTRVATLPDGSLVVTWGQYGTDGSGYGIYARTFDAPVNVINGTEGDDHLIGTAGDDIINGLGGNDLIHGAGGNDTLNGDDGDDVLEGQAGVDSFDGGAGFDRVSLHEEEATEAVFVDLGTQTIYNDGYGNAETMTSIEALGGGTRFADTFYGDDNRNLLVGSTGDTLDGFGGDDSFIIDGAPVLVDGGDGQDSIDLFRQVRLIDLDGDGIGEMESTTNGVHVDLDSGMIVDDGFGGAGAIFNVEHVAGSAGNDTLIGDANANVLSGLDGDDTLEGAAGNDTLDGGGGTDTASYANAAGAVDLALYAGLAAEYDAARVSHLSTDTLVGIENVTGSAFDDFLAGDGGDNVLQGRGGDDVMFGQLGNDTVDGGDGHDAIRGESGNDTVLGGGGDDFVDGGQGDDIVDGGDGWDRAAFFSMATTGVHVDLNIQGIAQDTNQGMDTLIGIEHLSGTLFDDVLIGNAGDNWLRSGSGTDSDTISGNDGNDLIEVGGGTHTLDGGMGVDTLSLFGNSTDITADGVTFSLALQGAAQDTEQGMMTATGFENLSGSIHDDLLGGDATANILLGDLGSDILYGDAGNDVLYGDGRYLVDTHGTGGSGPITLFNEADPQYGGQFGNDILIGGRGDDDLYGGRGDDRMTGNQGSDRFFIEAESGNDRVTDFSRNFDLVVFDPSSGADEFADLTLTQVGADTLVTWGTADSLLLERVRPQQLDEDNFQFGAGSLAATSLPAFSIEQQFGWSESGWGTDLF